MKPPQFITPQGILTGYVSLTIPSTNFDNNGTYSCQLQFANSDALEMMKTIDSFMEQSQNKYPEMKQAPEPYTIECNTLTVKFKAKAYRKYNNEIKHNDITFYDAGGNKIKMTGETIIRKGSTVRIQYSPILYGMEDYGCGVSLQIKAVQIIDLFEPEINF